MHNPVRAFWVGLLCSLAIASAMVLMSGSDAARAAGAVLYGVTGEGGAHSESLFRINHEIAATRLVTKLGNGGDGEEIAFNPRNGSLLHASGRVIGDDMILEWVNPATGAVRAIPVSGDECDEVSGLTYAGGGIFLAGTVDKLLCSISEAGVVKKIATLGMADIATGLAWQDGKLYATEWGNKTDLLTIDRSTGAVISVQKLKIDAADYRITALAAHPCTGELYAAIAIQKTVIRTPTSRSLVTINPADGKVKVIGDLGDNFAGLAFVSDGCEPEAARPNTGVGPIQALFEAGAQANRERSAAATAVVAVATPATAGLAAAVRPPNTGDGGLLDD
jgi:hypothetical protein